MKAQTQPTTPARQLLKEALEGKQRAIALEDKAQKVVQAASAAVEQARAEASSFAEVDEDAIKSRLAALKGEQGVKSPEQIREARRKRLLAQEELQGAEEVLQAAERELGEARGNVARAQKMCASHATSVLSELATDAIAAWQKLNEEREALRTILSALVMAEVPLEILSPQQRSSIMQGAVSKAGLPYGDVLDWQHLQEKAGAALAHRYEQPDPGPGIARARTYWAKFADAILADPAAEPAPLPSAAELWD